MSRQAAVRKRREAHSGQIHLCTKCAVYVTSQMEDHVIQVFYREHNHWDASWARMALKMCSDDEMEKYRRAGFQPAYSDLELLALMGEEGA